MPGVTVIHRSERQIAPNAEPSVGPGDESVPAAETSEVSFAEPLKTPEPKHIQPVDRKPKK